MAPEASFSPGGFLSSAFRRELSDMDEFVNGTAPVGGAPPAVIANGHDPAALAEARQLIETTRMPLTEIEKKLGIARRTLSKLKIRNGWQRPAGAPAGPALGSRGWQVATGPEAIAKKRGLLIARLYRACERQLRSLEAQIGGSDSAVEEKDVRTLGLLAKTLGTLMALDRDDGANLKDAEPVDRDKLNAELARRIARWAEGGEEPD
jgi:hypothetical protein